MKHVMSPARVLVASDNADDAQQVQRQLNAEFEHVLVSTDTDRSLEDFERSKPDVLVLAFDHLDKAQRYYLVVRLGGGCSTPSTVILCSKDEVRECCLCKRRFRRYVCMARTATMVRLAMSCGSFARMRGALNTPRPAELLAHAHVASSTDQRARARRGGQQPMVVTALGRGAQVAIERRWRERVLAGTASVGLSCWRSKTTNSRAPRRTSAGPDGLGHGYAVDAAGAAQCDPAAGCSDGHPNAGLDGGADAATKA